MTWVAVSVWTANQRKVPTADLARDGAVRTFGPFDTRDEAATFINEIGIGGAVVWSIVEMRAPAWQALPEERNG